ncbi:MAG TPA: hypothetical protein VJ746_05410 [Nitrospira sp.]|nr:hypothetical protein [Nitrospira sp.]
MRTNRSTFFVVLVILCFLLSITVAPVSAPAQDSTSGSDGSEGTGIQVASWALTVPYCLGKTAFAIGGGLVGGLGYLFSGGNAKTAKAIWVTSIYGTYILRPAHLRGEEPIHFLGQSSEDQVESVPRAKEPPPAPSEPPKK